MLSQRRKPMVSRTPFRFDSKHIPKCIQVVASGKATQFNSHSIPLTKDIKDINVDGGHPISGNLCSSQFRGVSWYKPASKWVSQISICGKPHFLGYFDKEEDAARQFDVYARRLGRSLNFPHIKTKMKSPDLLGFSGLPLTQTLLDDVTCVKPTGGLDQQIHTTSRKASPNTVILDSNVELGKSLLKANEKKERVLLNKGSSKFVGVRWHQANQKWTSYIRVGGRQMALGAFTSEEEAAKKYDCFAARHGRPLNFPQDKGRSSCAAVKVPRSKMVNKKRKFDTCSAETISTLSSSSFEGGAENTFSLMKMATLEHAETTGQYCLPDGQHTRKEVSDLPLLSTYIKGTIVLALQKTTDQWWPGIVVQQVDTTSSTAVDPLEPPTTSMPCSFEQHIKVVLIHGNMTDHSGDRHAPRSKCNLLTKEGNLEATIISNSNQVRLFSMSDRAPRGSVRQLKEAFIEARHHFLSSTVKGRKSTESQLPSPALKVSCHYLVSPTDKCTSSTSTVSPLTGRMTEHSPFKDTSSQFPNLFSSPLDALAQIAGWEKS